MVPGTKVASQKPGEGGAESHGGQQKRRPDAKWEQGGTGKQAQQGTMAGPWHRERAQDKGGATAEVCLFTEALTMTHGTKAHLALETGQTLVLQPLHSRPFADTWIPHRSISLMRPSSPPLPSWSLAKGALSCSLAGCQRDESKMSRNHTLPRIPYYGAHTSGHVPQHTPSLTIWLSKLLVSEGKKKGKKRKETS